MIKAKEWARPILITLARATPGEEVLKVCKNGHPGDDPSKSQFGGYCYYGNCECCSDRVWS